MATHSNILAWEIPWTEEPGELQPVGLQRDRHDLTIEHACRNIASTQEYSISFRNQKRFQFYSSIFITIHSKCSCLYNWRHRPGFEINFLTQVSHLFTRPWGFMSFRLNDQLVNFNIWRTTGRNCDKPIINTGFPGGSDTKQSSCNARDLGLIPLGKISWRREWLFSSLLSWRIPWTEEPGGLYIIYGIAKS